MGASQCTTTTVSGRPSPSRSPETCFWIFALTGPQSIGKRTSAGSGAVATTGAVLASGPAAWAAVAELGCRTEEKATTPATAGGGGAPGGGGGVVWASSGRANCCTRSVSCEGVRGGVGGPAWCHTSQVGGTAGWVLVRVAVRRFPQHGGVGVKFPWSAGTPLRRLYVDCGTGPP